MSVSAKHKLIDSAALTWAKSTYQGRHYQGLALRSCAVSDYARNWLAQHGQLPSGVHRVRLIRRLPWCRPPYPRHIIDFDRLFGRGPRNEP